MLMTWKALQFDKTQEVDWIVLLSPTDYSVQTATSEKVLNKGKELKEMKLHIFSLAEQNYLNREIKGFFFF